MSIDMPPGIIQCYHAPPLLLGTHLDDLLNVWVIEYDASIRKGTPAYAAIEAYRDARLATAGPRTAFTLHAVPRR